MSSIARSRSFVQVLWDRGEYNVGLEVWKSHLRQILYSPHLKMEMPLFSGVQYIIGHWTWLHYSSWSPYNTIRNLRSLNTREGSSRSFGSGIGTYFADVASDRPYISGACCVWFCKKIQILFFFHWEHPHHFPTEKRKRKKELHRNLRRSPSPSSLPRCFSDLSCLQPLLTTMSAPCYMIRLKRIYNFWCSMLVFTPFAYCFVTLSGTFMHFPELTY
jgi:hypothetical protein